TVAIVGGLVTIGHCVAIWVHRHPGSFGGDEAMYAADAFGIRRVLFSRHLVSGLIPERPQVRGVQLLSALLMTVGPRDPRTVLLAIPLLGWFSAISITAITRRIAKPAVAIAAGLVFLTMPTTVAASEAYYMGLGITAAMVGTLWALLASDQGKNWRILL